VRWKPRNALTLKSSVLAADTTQALSGIFDGLTGFSRVAVAVSGGSDSMALLRLVERWRTQPNGPREVYALTVDHGLRPESANEARQVATWCESLNIPQVILRWTGEKPMSGIQAKARSARYDLMSQWCRDTKVPVLMTAHTADDQAETVAMRRERTSSDRSLAAIWPENEWRGIKLLRPLLGERRARLRDFLNGIGQAWLEDPSNQNRDFERIRVRDRLSEQDIEPLRHLATAAQLKVGLADNARRAFLYEHMTVDDYAVLRLPRAALSAESGDLRIDVLSWALAIGGDGQTPERAIVEAIARWLEEGRENRRSANGAIVSARRHVVEVMREPARLRGRFVAVPAEGQVVFDGRFVVTAPEGSAVGSMGLPPMLKRPKDVPALAFSALPVVKMPDQTLHSAVKSGRDDISAMLCERFRP
jgi:tRNA(Ile)-lysidine synthase